MSAKKWGAGALNAVRNLDKEGPVNDLDGNLSDPDDDDDDAISTAAASSIGDGLSMDEDFVETEAGDGYTVRLRSCMLCGYSSNEMNPCLENKRYPMKLWPWAHYSCGNLRAPRGNKCQLCLLTAGTGGFLDKDECPTITKLAEQMKTNSTLTDEFVSAQMILVEGLNSGKIMARLRGCPKKKIMAEIETERKRVVELIKATGQRIKTKFKVMNMARWHAKYPGKDPKACGMMVRKIPKHGLCVLVRKLPEGEFDLELEDRQ